MPAKAGTADHSDRRTNNDRATGRNHDRASVLVATTIRATMFATAATFRGLGSEAREAQQGGECRNRKNFSAHLLGFLVFAGDVRPGRYKLLQCVYFPMNPT
jgi:hypothetical protein